MDSGRVRINSSLGAMRLKSDGRVVGDLEGRTQDISKHSGVPIDLVRTVLRRLPIPEHADGAELLKLLNYFLGGAAKERTPPEHRTLLTENAGTIRNFLNARMDDDFRLAATVTPYRAVASGEIGRSSTTLGALDLPSQAKGSHLSGPTAIERAEQSLKIAGKWMSIRRAELQAIPADAAQDQGRFLQRVVEEANLHRKSISAITRALHGSSGKDVRANLRNMISELGRFVSMAQGELNR